MIYDNDALLCKISSMTNDKTCTRGWARCINLAGVSGGVRMAGSRGGGILGSSLPRKTEKNPAARARMGHGGWVAFAMQCRHQFYFLKVNGAYKKRTPLGEAKRTPNEGQNVPLTWGGGVCIVYPGGPMPIVQSDFNFVKKKS